MDFSEKAELLLHPVRMRIVLTLTNRQMTAKALRRALPDVAQATLYRHINALHEGGLLTVAEERQVHSVTEKVYALDLAAANLGPQEVAAMTREDHMQAFTVFVAALMASFGRYLERDEVDLMRDGVSYRQAALYLSDDELREMAHELSAVILKWMGKPPAEGRTRRLLTTILMPEEEHDDDG